MSFTACEKLLTDGTGKPNADAINYYNNFIDALLGKGHPLNYFLEFNFPVSDCIITEIDFSLNKESNLL